MRRPSPAAVARGAQLRQRRMEEAVERQFGDQLSPEEYRVIARQVTMLKLRPPALGRCDGGGCLKAWGWGKYAHRDFL